MKQKQGNSKNNELPEVIENLKEIWRKSENKKFDFCIKLNEAVEANKKDKKKLLKNLYEEIKISRRMAEKYRKVGEVFNKYEYAHVSAYKMSHLIRLACLEKIGQEIVSNKKQYTAKQLDLIIKHKNQLEEEKKIKQVDDPHKSAEECEKEEQKNADPCERLTSLLKSKSSMIMKNLEQMDINLTKLAKLSREEQISYKKMTQHSKSFNEFVQLCDKVKKQVEKFLDIIENDDFRPDLEGLGTYSASRHIQM